MQAKDGSRISWSQHGLSTDEGYFSSLIIKSHENLSLHDFY